MHPLSPKPRFASTNPPIRSGCNHLTGQFKVLAADFDYSFQPARTISFAAEFEQRREEGGSLTQAFIYYNFVPFDFCIQDDSSGSLLQINTTTGEYQFTNCGGLTIGGVGVLAKRGSLIILQHTSSDRRVMATIDTPASRATASVQLFAQGRTFSLTDRNITSNTCACR